MQWISQNWVWVLFFVAFIGMHLFGHGGHGGHGGHSRGSDPSGKEDMAAGPGTPAAPKPTGHQH